MTPPRPLLVIGIGNPSRGDDALGPALVDRLRSADACDDVDWLLDYQLQVEHALDLAGRAAVLFIDAARPGQAGSADGVALSMLTADGAAAHWTTHALRPEALLAVCTRALGQAPPPAWLLAIEGEAFELGAALSAAAQARLPRAQALATDWLRAQLEGDLASHSALRSNR